MGDFCNPRTLHTCSKQTPCFGAQEFPSAGCVLQIKGKVVLVVMPVVVSSGEGKIKRREYICTLNKNFKLKVGLDSSLL